MSICHRLFEALYLNNTCAIFAAISDVCAWVPAWGLAVAQTALGVRVNNAGGDIEG